MTPRPGNFVNYDGEQLKIIENAWWPTRIALNDLYMRLCVINDRRRREVCLRSYKTELKRPESTHILYNFVIPSQICDHTNAEKKKKTLTQKQVLRVKIELKKFSASGPFVVI